MTDSLLQAVKDSILKAVTLRTDSIFNSNLDIIGKVDSFYSNSISLIVTLIAVIAPIAIGLVSFAAVWIQKRNYKLERESINAQIKEVCKEFENYKEQTNDTLNKNNKQIELNTAELNLFKFENKIENTSAVYLSEISMSIINGNYKNVFNKINSALNISVDCIPYSSYNRRFIDLLADCLKKNYNDLSKQTAESLIKVLKIYLEKISEKKETAGKILQQIFVENTIQRIVELLPSLKTEPTLETITK